MVKAVGIPTQERGNENWQLATRRDIDDLRRDMRELEQRIIIKLGAMMAISIGTVAALVKLL